MPVTPTSLFSKVVANTEQLIADSATFQTLVGAADADAAKESINQSAHPDEDSGTFEPPYCLIQMSDVGAMEQRSFGSWNTDWPLSISFELETPAEHSGSRRDAHLWFLNQIGGIWKDSFVNMVNTPHLYPNFQRIVPDDFAEGHPDDNNGLYLWGVIFLAFWEGQF